MSYQEVYRALNEGMKKEALYGKGMLKAAIKQLFSSLRTPGGDPLFYLDLIDYSLYIQ